MNDPDPCVFRECFIHRTGGPVGPETNRGRASLGQYTFITGVQWEDLRLGSDYGPVGIHNSELTRCDLAHMRTGEVRNCILTDCILPGDVHFNEPDVYVRDYRSG